ncbi:MAG: MarR family transcriptional regulator [Bacteroidetes bacterium]|nr:MAG: MarR family transcriptional regulator [Bacteroidota bacterium]
MHQIISTGYWIINQVGKELKEFGITEPQYNVLRTLIEADEQPLTVQAIQEKMIQKNSNVSRIIDKLLDKGLVGRKECPSNRRKVDIVITESGKSLLKVLDKKILAFHHPMMQNLNEEELKTLTQLIIKFKS